MSRSWTFVLINILILVASSWTLAAVQSQGFIDQERKLSFNIKQQKWIFFGPEDYESKGTLFVARPKDSKNISALLTWRVDESDISSTKKYAEKWLRDYPKFGFELEATNLAKYGDLDGFEIELKNQTSSKKIKQFIVKNEKEFWIFTCSANSQEFKNAWSDCKKILQTAKFN